MKERQQYDIVIIGGGIAGMTAAVYAARANRSCILLESNITGGLANSTYLVENFPSYTEIHGMELMQRLRDQVEHLEVPVEEVCEVEKLDLFSTIKSVETDDAIYEAKAVILATGRKNIPLELPRDCDQVHHCAICDGSPYKDKKIIVVGGGNSAFDESLYLLQLGVGHLTIVEKMDRYFAAQTVQEDLLGRDNVEGYLSSEVKDVILEDDKLKTVILHNTATGEDTHIDADGIFVFLGQLPNSELFADAIKLDKVGYIIADADMRTNLPGVFSAGDINAKTYRQLTTAAADGTIAALSADRYLRTV